MRLTNICRWVPASVCVGAFAFLLTTSGLAQPVKGNARQRPPQSLQRGIKQTQAELQRVSALIQETIDEMADIRNSAFVSLAGVLAGPQAAMDDGKHATQIAQAIKALSDFWGTFQDSAQATKDSVLQTDPWLKLSDDLKVVMDLVGAVNEPAAVANTSVEMSVKSAQFAADYVELLQLRQVQGRLQTALDKLISKDPETQKHVQAEQDRALNQLALEQRIQSEILKNYYKDRSPSILLTIQDASTRGLRAAHHVAAGLAIADPNQDILHLTGIPGINPDFIRAVACDRKAAQDFLSTGSNAAIVEGHYCRRYADGSYIPAFLSSPADPAQFEDLASQAERSGQAVQRSLSSLQNERSRLNFEKTMLDSEFTAAQDTRSTLQKLMPSTDLFPQQEQKIPAGWVPCECPAAHPHAGLYVNGTQYHTPLLQCPK